MVETIKRFWDPTQHYHIYQPNTTLVKCKSCGYVVAALVYQIVEKKHHETGKLFCPQCGPKNGKLEPIEEIKIID